MEESLEGVVKPGDVLAGKYQVERVLGVGGMGVVVSAMHLELDEHVAIKFLLPSALQNADAVARFAREARAAVKIKSEHVARVTDVGKLETGAPYMVMEYLSGSDLSNILEQRRQLPVVEAIEHVLQACEAVAEAHVLGIVHRDLKPANLFLSRRADGSACVKVLDFGISKVTPQGGGSTRDHAMTRTTAVMGSPLYMSPEQMASSKNADPRSDIWALGAIVYELITGAPPFNAETMPQLCTLIITSPPPSMSAYRPDLPPGLEAAIVRCMEKDPNRRYANVAELTAALAPFASARATASAERVARVITGSRSHSVPPNAGGTLPLANSGMSASGSISGSSNPAITGNPAAHLNPRTSAAWGETRPPAQGAGGAIAIIAILMTMFGIAGVGGFFLLRSRTSVPAAAPQTTAIAAAPATAAPPASSVPGPSVAPDPSVQASADVPPAVSASATPSAHPVAVSPVAKPTPKGPGPAPAGPKPVKSLFGDRN